MGVTLMTLVLMSANLPAQVQGPPSGDSLGRDLAIKAILTDGHVKLRWATGNTVVWRLIRNDGVYLSRQEADEQSPLILNGNQPLRIWDESAWKLRSESIPSAAQVATLLKDDPKELKGISEYAQADLEQNKLTSFLLLSEFSFEIAQGLALAYEDTVVARGKIYRYEIILPDSANGDTIRAECFVSTADEMPLPPVGNLQAVPGDRQIDLFWNRISLFSGYFIERRPKGDNQWQKLNDRPLIFATNYSKPHLYRDSVANYISYEYRVIGLDAFGRLSGPSSSVVSIARDLTPPKPPYSLDWSKRENGVMINWKNPLPEPDLAGYGLLKSDNPDENFAPVHKELLAPGTESFFDSLPQPGTYFYRLIAADTSGNVSAMSVRAMAVIDDTIPPQPPSGITAMADTSGIITLRWKHCSEGDAAGYRVYRQITGGVNPEYFPLTSSVIIDSTYGDTLISTVRDKFSYYVTCVDFVGNYSRPSDIVMAAIPDRTAPVTPIIEKYSVEDRKVNLQFYSASHDVEKYEIHRILQENNKLDIVMVQAAAAWTDSTTQSGMQYAYEIVAIDSAHNRSLPSKRIFAKPLWEISMDTPPPPQATYDKPNRAVIVKWPMPAESEYSVVVFRRVNGGSFQQASPELKSDTFIDSKIFHSRYEYAIKFYFPARGSSAMSPGTLVEIADK
jgi:hypothetical protein